MNQDLDVSDKLLNILRQNPELVKSALDAIEKIVFTLGKLNSEGKLDNTLFLINIVVDKLSTLNPKQRDKLAKNLSSIIDILALDTSDRLNIDMENLAKKLNVLIHDIDNIYRETNRGLTIREIFNIVRSVEFARALKIVTHIFSSKQTE